MNTERDSYQLCLLFDRDVERKSVATATVSNVVQLLPRRLRSNENKTHSVADSCGDTLQRVLSHAESLKRQL